jgi:hypothetical protein
MDGRDEMQTDSMDPENGNSEEGIDPSDRLPLSVEINWTASRLPSLLIEPAVSQHKFAFTTSFSIGPSFPAPDGDEIADLFDHDYTIVGGGQINDETVLVASSATSDVRIAIDGRAVDILVAAESFKLAREIGLVLKDKFPKTEKRPDVLSVRTWYAGFQGVTSSYSDLLLPSWDEIAPNYPEPTRTQLRIKSRNRLRDSGASLLLKTPTSIWGLTRGQATIRPWTASSTSRTASLARGRVSSTC